MGINNPKSEDIGLREAQTNMKQLYSKFNLTA